MKYEETCSHGSFTVWGTGFRYDYKAPGKTLDIAHLDKERAFAYLKFDRHVSKAPLSYVESLNKTNQIKALKYSNNATINLAEIIDHNRVTSLIKTTAKISRLVFYLNHERFGTFSRAFREDFPVKNLKIKKFVSRTYSEEFYIGRLQTLKNNTISIRNCTLPALMAQLSEGIITDLITMEVGRSSDSAVHQLLNVSSKLSTIGRVLDQNFVPWERISSDLYGEKSSYEHDKTH